MTQDQINNLTQLVQLGLQKLHDDAMATVAEAASLIPAAKPDVTPPTLKPRHK